MRLSIRKALAASVAAAALVFGAAGAAQAAPTIDTSRDGSSSITITKVAGNGQAPRQNGLPQDNATPVPGATFKVERLAMTNKITTPEGQAEALKLTPTSAKDSTFTARTVEAGSAKVDNLPFGVYLVTETKAPAGYLPTQPFLVYLPFTNPSNNSDWVYDAYVYPKNSTFQVEKTVEDAGQQVGQDIKYHVTSTVPVERDPSNPAGFKTLNRFEFNDKLDSRLTTDAGRISVDLLNPSGAVITTLAQGADYTLTIDAQNNVNAVLTDAGRGKVQSNMSDANVGMKLRLNIQATINDWGVVPNEAVVIVNNGGGEGDVTYTTNRVISVWGQLNISKVGTAGAKLAGAEFELYTCDANGAISGSPLSVKGATKWTTDAEGKASISGIHVGNYADDKPITINQNYCLVETKAPAGYELLTKPLVFNITYSNAAADKEKAMTDIVLQPTGLQELVNNQTVTNIESGKLPLTGGTGIAIFSIIGAAIIAGGIYAARRVSKSTAK